MGGNRETGEENESAVAVEILVDTGVGEESCADDRHAPQKPRLERKPGSGAVDCQTSHDELFDREQQDDERQKMDGEKHRYRRKGLCPQRAAAEQLICIGPNPGNQTSPL